MVLDHIGIVVPSIADGVKQWEELFGYKKKTEVVFNSRQKVNVVFLAKPGSLPIKLIEPVGDDSTVYRFARKGGGVHHLCFRCDDVQLEIPILKEKGAVFVTSPQPGEAFNNHDIAFFLAKHNLNIELIDTPEKRGWSDE